MNCRLLQNENTFLSLQLKECLDTIEDLKESLKKYELEDDKDEDDSYTYNRI